MCTILFAKNAYWLVLRFSLQMLAQVDDGEYFVNSKDARTFLLLLFQVHSTDVTTEPILASNNSDEKQLKLTL